MARSRQQSVILSGRACGEQELGTPTASRYSGKRPGKRGARPRDWKKKKKKNDATILYELEE